MAQWPVYKSDLTISTNSYAPTISPKVYKASQNNTHYIKSAILYYKAFKRCCIHIMALNVAPSLKMCLLWITCEDI